MIFPPSLNKLLLGLIIINLYKLYFQKSDNLYQRTYTRNRGILLLLKFRGNYFRVLEHSSITTRTTIYTINFVSLCLEF